MTGICDGKRWEESIGNVIIATDAFNYQRGKESDEGHKPEPILFCPEDSDSFIPWVKMAMSTKGWSSHITKRHPECRVSPKEFLRRVIWRSCVNWGR
jgi:hypothetical protein